MADAVQTMAALRALTESLDEGSKEIYRLQEADAKATEIYDDLFNDLLLALMEEYDKDGTLGGIKYPRLPGEDIRNATAVKKMRDLYPLEFNDHRRTRAKLNRAQDRSKALERQISALQSVLSMLRVEASAVG